MLIEQISQSLASRIAVLELLPLSYKELTSFGDFAKESIWQLIYHGLYPGTFINKTPINMWYKSYITTYLERDVPQLLQVKDISKFHLFLRICAGRHGQLVNMSEIGSACGVSHTTISELISILEASYIIFRLQPYYKNFNKRLAKSPKLYFYDSGLVAYLLGIESAEHAKIHAARGALFEGFVISEVYKQIVSQAKSPNIFFWNAHKSFEVDLLIEKGDKVHAIEIKSSATFNKNFVLNVNKWLQIPENNAKSDGYVIYSGINHLIYQNIQIIPYRDIASHIG